MKYYFKPDKLVIIISIIVLITVGMTISIIPWNSLGSIILFFLIVGILAYSLAIMPLWLVVNDKSIVIQQLIGYKKFKKKDINIQPINSSDLKGSIRVFGSSGYGGYTGWFRNKVIGKYFMLILNKKELALVQTKSGKKYIINYPQELLQEATES